MTTGIIAFGTACRHSATWGRMLADAQTYLGAAPWLAIMPGLAIALAVFGLNLLGDGLRDLLDPRDTS